MQRSKFMSEINFRYLVAVAGVVAVVVSLAACGGGGSSSTESSGNTTEETTTEAGGGGSTDSVVEESQKITEQANKELVYSTVEEPTKTSQIVPYGKWRGPKTAPSHESGKNIQVIECTKVAPSCVEAANGVVEAAKQLGWNAELIDGGGTPQGFQKAFNTAFSRNPDAIVGLAVPSEVIGPSLEEASQKGIVTIGVADEEPASGAKYSAYVPFPQPTMTALLGWSVIAETEGEANVLAVANPEVPGLVTALSSLEQVTSTCEGCSVSKVNLPVAEMSDPSKVNAVIGGGLANQSGTNYVYMPFSLPLSAISQTIASKGSEAKLIGMDADEVMLKAVKEGSMSQAVGCPLAWLGWASIDQVVRGLAGEPYLSPSEQGFGVLSFNQENVPADANIEDSPALIDFRKEYERIWGN